AQRLFGRVGEVVVELGSSSAFLAPAAGMLDLMINHAGKTTGQLDVTIGRGVVPARSLDAIAAGGLSRNASANVPPDGDWHTTSFSVTRGEPIVFSATGTVTTKDGSHDPFGIGTFGGTSYAVVNSSIDALHGRIGDQVMLLGGEGALLAPASGALELAVNA